ncbi:MAG: relaxase/mobilization nuclease domain-containing protein [Candidatus Cryptobacteroides sp.]
MIVEIHQSSPTMAGTLRYNEDKVRSGVASVLCTANIGSDDLDVVNRVFEQREREAIRELEHVSFQMSVNPSVSDDIDESRIPAFVEELMEGLGYGTQPWVVFRHNDIERVHYHVVSIRVDEDGRKIRDYYEKRQCDRIVQALEWKYGYVKGRAEETPEREKASLPVFSEGSGDVVRSIENCVRDSLSYHFTTERQFAEILRCHGVRVQEGLGTRDLAVHLSFQGLDREGRPCTGSISDAQLSFDVRDTLDRRLEECRMTDPTQNRSELRHALSEALRSSGDIPSLQTALRGKHIDLVIYTDREGKPRGTTLIDHRSRCAFKGSEVSRTLSGSLLSLASGPSGGSSDDKDGRTSDEDRHTENAEGERTNSGITEALSTLLAGMTAGGSGQKGKNLEDPMAKKKKKKKRLAL